MPPASLFEAVNEYTTRLLILVTCRRRAAAVAQAAAAAGHPPLAWCQQRRAAGSGLTCSRYTLQGQPCQEACYSVQSCHCAAWCLADCA